MLDVDASREKFKTVIGNIFYYFLLFPHSINISLPGLPPLPKSLRIVDPILNQHDTTFTSIVGGKGASSTLDTQLALLKREMVSFTSLELEPENYTHFFN